MTEQQSRTPVAVLLPVTGGFAVLACATAMAGLITGGAWFAQLFLAVGVVVCLGIVLRGLRRSTGSLWIGPLTTVAQLFALLCLCVLMYSGNGVLGILPGPSAMSDIAHLLTESIAEIRVGTQPITGSTALLCLIVLSVGIVTVLVDLLVVEVRTPAVAGLLLLCLYAVPASLSDELLPWWSFALGAAAFALLLAADRAQRHQEWRGSVGLSPTSGLRLSPPMIAVTGVAVVVALIAGAGITGVGTKGTLPGESEDTTAVSRAWGLNPFTKLAGELNQPDHEVELFRVQGLPDDGGYLRAVTLSAFDPRDGWRVGTPGSGQQLFGELQPPPGSSHIGPTTRISLFPINWQDNWLPLFGVPEQVSGLEPRVWRWDPGVSAAFARVPTRPRPYVEQAQLHQPTAEQLRDAPEGTDGLADAAAYTETPKVDASVDRLAHRLTDNQPTTFDKARAIWQYLTSGQYTYSLETPPVPPGADPTAEFLFHGKRGFCEQFSSAMAVMLRLLNVPARVAVGFTAGTQQNGYRSISTQDAHAWVEVYFPGQGWLPFDPTPLSGGRGITPQYLLGAQDSGVQNRPAGPVPAGPMPPVSRAPGPREDRASSAAAAPGPGGPRWWPPLASPVTLSAPAGAVWVAGGLAGLALLGTVAVFVLLRRPPRGAHARGAQGRAAHGR